MKRIGVVSDSHGNIMNLQDAVLAMGEVDAIFHRRPDRKSVV